MEAMPKTRKANQPISVAEPAMLPSRSSNTFGSVNVVDWKMMLEIAVVKKMIAVRRISARLAAPPSVAIVLAPWAAGFRRGWPALI